MIVKAHLIPPSSPKSNWNKLGLNQTVLPSFDLSFHGNSIWKLYSFFSLFSMWSIIYCNEEDSLEKIFVLVQILNGFIISQNLELWLRRTHNESVDTVEQFATQFKQTSRMFCSVSFSDLTHLKTRKIQNSEWKIPFFKAKWRKGQSDQNASQSRKTKSKQASNIPTSQAWLSSPLIWYAPKNEREKIFLCVRPTSWLAAYQHL